MFLLTNHFTFFTCMNFLFKVICSFFYWGSLFSMIHNCPLHYQGFINLSSVMYAINIFPRLWGFLNFDFCCTLKLNFYTFKCIHLLLWFLLCYAGQVLSHPIKWTSSCLFFWYFHSFTFSYTPLIHLTFTLVTLTQFPE